MGDIMRFLQSENFSESDSDLHSFLSESLFPQIHQEQTGSEKEISVFEEKIKGQVRDDDLISEKFQITVTSMVYQAEQAVSMKQSGNSKSAEDNAPKNRKAERSSDVQLPNHQKRKYKRVSKDFEKLELRKDVLVRYFKAFFLGTLKEGEFDQDLKDHERMLIDLIVAKKTKKGKKNLKISTSVATKKRNSFKRIEENKKFVFKRLIKQMRKKKGLTPKQLFQFYFSKIATENSEPVEIYMLPKSVNHPENFSSFSQLYICLIKRSPEFIADIDKAADEYFSKDNIERLISKDVEKFFKSLLVKFSEAESFSKVEEYLKKIRCKLPWTLAETNTAVTCFRQYLQC